MFVHTLRSWNLPLAETDGAKYLTTPRRYTSNKWLNVWFVAHWAKTSFTSSLMFNSDFIRGVCLRGFSYVCRADWSRENVFETSAISDYVCMKRYLQLAIMSSSPNKISAPSGSKLSFCGAFSRAVVWKGQELFPYLLCCFSPRWINQRHS